GAVLMPEDIDAPVHLVVVQAPDHVRGHSSRTPSSRIAGCKAAETHRCGAASRRSALSLTDAHALRFCVIIHADNVSGVSTSVESAPPTTVSLRPAAAVARFSAKKRANAIGWAMDGPWPPSRAAANAPRAR